MPSEPSRRLGRPHEIADSGAVVNLDQPRVTSSALCGAVGMTPCLEPCWESRDRGKLCRVEGGRSVQCRWTS